MKPKNTNPESYPHRILVAVTGMSPQIVTETLYTLAVQQEPKFVPTEVRLITTEEGAQQAKQSLLHKDRWFHRLLTDYDLPPIQFEPEQIHVLKDANGNPLDDIRSVEDNTAAADAITDLIRKLTGDDSSALHVSIAGGRKTMGFYLGYVLSLFGRIQDRLSHVLVPPSACVPGVRPSRFPQKSWRSLPGLPGGRRRVQNGWSVRMRMCLSLAMPRRFSPNTEQSLETWVTLNLQRNG